MLEIHGPNAAGGGPANLVVVRGGLDPEVGAVFLRALEAASDRLFEQGRSEAESPAGHVPAGTRLADALGFLAEAALAHDLDPGTRGDRYQVVLHVDADVLRAQDPDSPTERPGMSMLEDAIDVPAGTSDGGVLPTRTARAVPRAAPRTPAAPD